MLHFFGILSPSSSGRARNAGTQSPFFGPDWRLSRGERDEALLAEKFPPAPDEVEAAAEDGKTRFVTLMPPPYF